MRYKLMAITDSDGIDVLDLSMRVYNALRRNNIGTVGAARHLTDDEFLRMRNIGSGSLAAFVARLAELGVERDPQADAWQEGPAHGQPVPVSAPPGLEHAQWIGHQLEALAEDDRAAPRNRLGGRYTGLTPVEQRRYAWGMYLWAVERTEERMPELSKSGDGFNAYPLPGSFELHLEGLNRLAREKLGD